jgi:ABC-type proline/glycine betaine transport system permease subunit
MCSYLDEDIVLYVHGRRDCMQHWSCIGRVFSWTFVLLSYVFLLFPSLLKKHAFKRERELNKVTCILTAISLCTSWRMKDQLDVTCYFISLLMCSTCFGHWHIHLQKLATVLLNDHISRLVLVERIRSEIK